MKFDDEIARLNHLSITREIQAGAKFTQPLLNLDVSAFEDYRSDRALKLPEPFCDDPRDVMVMTGIKGKKVLCLASGGGQQSAVFGLLGAQVTVLDLHEGQLDGDLQAARHYGYAIAIEQGDMRDLSRFEQGTFDLVYQAISIIFIPDVRQVYREVARVVKPGGLYTVDHAEPAVFPTTFSGTRNGWDGIGYRIAEPYLGGPVRIDRDGCENMLQGEPTGEFRHLFADIFNGLIESGFIIRGVWDTPRSGQINSDQQYQPGTETHRNQVIPLGLSIVAVRNL